MSLPIPNDRARVKQDSGVQPYKDAKETLAESDAQLQADAERFGEERLRESDAEREKRVKAEAEAILKESRRLRSPDANESA
jgi:hypothetical protein